MEAQAAATEANSAPMPATVASPPPSSRLAARASAGEALSAATMMGSRHRLASALAAWAAMTSNIDAVCSAGASRTLFWTRPAGVSWSVFWSWLMGPLVGGTAAGGRLPPRLRPLVQPGWGPQRSGRYPNRIR